MITTTVMAPRNPGTTVGITPATGETLPPRPERGDYTGHYQSVLLNVRTGELRFHGADWRTSPTPGTPEWDEHHPGTLLSWRWPQQWSKPVDEVLRWTIDSGVEARPYLTARQGNDFLNLVAPLAQTLVEQLFRVPGTEDLDWSAESVTAMRDIHLACRRSVESPQGQYPDLVNFDHAVSAVPALVRPTWPELDDATLDRQAANMTLHGTSENWHRDELRAAFAGRPSSDGTHVYLDLLGVRSWAYAWRAAVRAGTPDER